jgi:hypothetical protein
VSRQVEVSERELSPEGDYQLIDSEGSETHLVEHEQQHAQEDQDSEGHNLVRRGSQWVFPIFGRRREGSDN